MRLQPACLLTLLLLLLSLSAAAAVTQRHASMSPQQTRWRQRQISGWTYFSSCGDTMCANMSTQLARIVKHSDTIDTMFVGLGGAAQHYNINHSLCYNSTSQPIADTSNTFPWATFRFGSRRENLPPLDGDGSGRYLCIPPPASLVTAWAVPLRAAGVAILPGISGWPVVWPVSVYSVHCCYCILYNDAAVLCTMAL